MPDFLKKEKNLLLIFSFIGIIVGIFYANDIAFPSKKWLEKFLRGLAIMSILSGVIIRYMIAVSREKSASISKQIKETLEETGEQIIKKF